MSHKVAFIRTTCLLLLSACLIPSIQPFFAIQTSREEIEEAGTYPVTYSYYDEATDKYIEVTEYVILERPRTIISEYNGEGIDASDFTIEPNKIMTLTDAELIARSHAHAWNLVDGTSIEITDVILQPIDTKQGLYKLQFATAKGTETTITAREQAPSVTLPTEEYIGEIGYQTLIEQWMLYFLVPILLLLILLLILFIFSLRKTRQVEELLYNKSNPQAPYLR